MDGKGSPDPDRPSTSPRPSAPPKGHDLGPLGEELAARHLIRDGYTILSRNYRFGHREIDLIVSRGGVVAFVEVKSRSGLGYGHPLAAITALKRREVERVAHRWIQRHGRPGTQYRFDAVAVLLEGPGSEARIEHLVDAWRLGE